jgi:serine/threonine protein kinase
MVVANQQAAPRPRIVGRYALFDEIAAGGMATIHLGRLVGPVGFSRTVAIKTLHPQFAKDPEFVEMFLEEARLASRIQHPNVISTVDVATTEGEVFLVMEYVAGESLAKLVRSALKKGERLPVDVAASILAGMLHGLHATHEAKNEQLEPMLIVHRDVSPQNVLVGLDGIARIFDFGVAKAAAMRSQATTDGQMKGKLSYMSPEQLNSREVDRRTDVFAAGIVAWESLTGRRLFAGSDPGEVLAKVLTLDIQAPAQVAPSVPQNVSDTVMRALERSPTQRWQTARDFAIELERNVALAAPHVVGNWVEQNASEALRDRRHRVEAVERASVDLGHVGMGHGGIGHAGMNNQAPGLFANSVLAQPSHPPNHGASFAPERAPLPGSPPEASNSDFADGGDFASGGSGTTRSSSLSVSSSRAASSGSTLKRQLGWSLFIGVLGASVAAGFWYWQNGGLGGGDWDSSPTALPEPPSNVRSTPANPEPQAPGPSGAAPKDGPGPPVIAFDSLPEHRDAPDASLAAALRGAAAARANAQVRRAGRRVRASTVPVAAPPPVKDAPSPPPLPAAAPAEPEKDAPKSECEPPWYMDAKGIQRLKPKCL